MIVFAHQDYRKILAGLVAERKKLGSKLNLSRVAESMRVQRPYLSKVLGGRAHLSADQMFLACRFLGLNSTQTRYLLLLLERSRCSVRERQEELDSDISKLQGKHLRIQEHLEAKAIAPTLSDDSLAPYYLDPAVQLTHLFLTVPRYRRNPAAIGTALGLTPDRLASAIGTLTRMGIVEAGPAGLGLRVERLHLPRESPLCLPQQLLFRLKSFERIQALPPESCFGFAVTFSADPASQSRIRQKLLKFIQKLEREVRVAPSEEVYQLNLDFFPWSSL